MADDDSDTPSWPFSEEPPPIPTAPAPVSFEPPYEPPPMAPPVAGPPIAYPPPAPGQPPPPPARHQAVKKSRKNIWITIAVVVGILVLAIGSCTVWFVNTVKAPVDESNRFLAFIDQGDYTSAAAMVSPSCSRGDITAERLTEMFDRQPISYDLKSSSVTNSDAVVSGSFSSTAVRGNQITLRLRNNDGWKICSFSV